MTYDRAAEEAMVASAASFSRSRPDELSLVAAERTHEVGDPPLDYDLDRARHMVMEP